ncbi:MAG: outer membrane beta-barrel protein [Chitinophagales bacterium]
MKQSKKIQFVNNSININHASIFYLKSVLLCLCFFGIFWTSSSTYAQSSEGEIDTLAELEVGDYEGEIEFGIQDSIKKDKKTKKDSTRWKFGGIDIIIRDKGDESEVKAYLKVDDEDSDDDDEETSKSKVKTRWFMLDFGFNTYLADGSFNLPNELNDFDLDYARSVNVNMHIFRQRIGLVGHNFNFMYGLELAWNNYHFENDITLLHNVDEVTVIESGVDFKKNKLATTFLQVPVLFNIETNPRKPGKSFRISAGGYGGLLLGARTKQKSSENGKVKIKDDFNLNKFRYGVIGQVGVGCINFYVDYALNGLFKEDLGPDLRPISIGFTLVPF